MCDQLLYSSLFGGWGDVLGQFTGIHIINPQALVGALWAPCTHGHQVVNFFRLVGVLASVKQLRKCASGTVI